MTPEAMLGGFTDASVQSAHAFRATLQALALPGTLHSLTGAAPPAPLSVAAGVLVLTLCDGATPVQLAGAHDCAALRDWITFHTGAPVVSPQKAMFAIGVWDALQPLDRFAIGQPDYPDRSVTLIVDLPELTVSGPRLTGPGIQTETRLSLPETAAFAQNRALFPLGFDCFFTAGARVAGLPRSTIVKAA
jgi:alpha-D-ribose 1-methylphosphonate 5-triphosphate synthase subunit PhnH